MTEVGRDRGGWVELSYGEGGNVETMTVHAQCGDAPATTCEDPGLTSTTRADEMRAACVCKIEQHYQYRWDELNRMHEARRYDRFGGSGDWALKVRQRYRYDAGNGRLARCPT